MSSFEYVMVLVSIIIGLAITHILTAFSVAIHRLRGHGEPIRLDAVYLLWVVYVLIWLVSFWWWEFRFQEIVEEWSFGLYLFIIGYAISLFLMVAVLVPAKMERLTDSYAFFMEGRKWFFGIHLFVLGVDIIDSFLKGVEFGLRPSVLMQYGVFVAASIVGLSTERRPIQLAAAAAVFVVQLMYMFMTLGMLGLA